VRNDSRTGAVVTLGEGLAKVASALAVTVDRGASLTEAQPLSMIRPVNARAVDQNREPVRVIRSDPDRSIK
jgi:hypothetical protein